MSTKLFLYPTADGDQFGQSVAVDSDGSTVMVGAPDAEDPSRDGTFGNEGLVGHFERPAGGWPSVMTRPS
jgi:hypothetical protein